MAHAKLLKTEPVTIELGGKTRTIKFDLNAYAELELKFGTIQTAMDALQNGSVISLRSLLWAGLIHEEAKLDDNGEPTGYNLTPFQVGSWIEPHMIEDVSRLLVKSISASMPEEEVNKLLDGKNM